MTAVISRIRDTDPDVFALYGSVSSTGKPEKMEFFVQALQMWFAISADCPEKECFVAMFDVITERKRAEEELRLRTAGLEAALDAQRDVVLECDTALNVTRASPTFELVFGFAPASLNLRDLLRRVACKPMEGEPWGVSELPMACALRGERVVARTCAVSCADGREAVVEASVSPMRSGGGIVGAVEV